MIYFDTDLLVHYFVGYDTGKHQQASELVRRALSSGTFFISFLSVQEVAFAMAKLKQADTSIQSAVAALLATYPASIDVDAFKRASDLAATLGFKNINDCLHTAIAEAQDCSELITYNRKEFDRIRPLTNLTVTVLASIPPAP